MPTFEKIAAQGEITLIRIGDVPKSGATDTPEGFSNYPPENGKLIVGHSETGHSHVMDPAKTEALVMDRPPEGMRILQLIVREPDKLEHLRQYDTHKAIDVPPGVYQARIAREYDPYANIARRVAD